MLSDLTTVVLTVIVAVPDASVVNPHHWFAALVALNCAGPSRPYRRRISMGPGMAQASYFFAVGGTIRQSPRLDRDSITDAVNLSSDLPTLRAIWSHTWRG